MNSPLDDYLNLMSSKPEGLFDEITRRTYLTTIYPRQLSGSLQGKFLELISFMIKPKRILEIGTFTAYSTLCLVKGLDPAGELITIEADEELETTIRRHIALAGEEKRIRLIIGKALETIPQIEADFDLIFLDADKANYPVYYPLLHQLLKPGGFLLADNVLWSMKVIDQQANDHETAAIREFNRIVSEDQSVTQLILPLRDGISLIRKK